MSASQRERTILVIHDYADVRELLGLCLTEARLDVRLAADIRGAIALAEQSMPGVAIVDLSYWRDAWQEEFMGLAKHPCFSKGTKFIVTFQSPTRQDIDAAMASGASVVHRSSWSPDELVASVSSLLAT